MIERIVTVARVYAREGHDLLNQALDILQNEKISGVTVLGGIEGIGASGGLHSSSLLDLPLIIEFYDEPEKVEKAIVELQSRLDFRHIVSWPARVHADSNC